MRTGFNLIYANDADRLVEHLAARLRVRPDTSNLLVPEIILVPQFGLRRWLEIRLAQNCGVLANVNFFAPAEYAWQLLRAANPGLRERSPFEASILRWRIFGLLEELALTHPALRAALGTGAGAERLALATELAHSFERDLAYRSNVLRAWERRAAPADWRADLWRRLVAAAGEPHRAALIEAYAVRFRNSGAAVPGLPSRLTAFGCTNISPDLLGFYNIVARHCDVDFLMPNPCREYWGDVRSQRDQLRDGGADAFGDEDNPILAAYGQAGRDFVAQIFSYEFVQPVQEVDLSSEPCGTHLLQRVQRDVLNRQAPQDQPAPAADDSITFHLCHSRLREVQVLHDHILDWLQSEPTLLPRDIAVMTPDIAAYAPYVEAVFGSINAGDPRYLPYNLSDSPPGQRLPLVGVVEQLLALPTSRFGLNEVLDWLALPATMQRFELDPNEIAMARGWLNDAGVRWALDAEQRQALGAGDYSEFTWRFGLERLLLGTATGTCDDLVAGIAPYPAVEGAASRVLGRVLRVVDLLSALRREQQALHSATEWQKIYNDVLYSLFDAPELAREDAKALQRLRAALADFAEETRAAGMDLALDWRCVRDDLSARLGQPERSFRFFGGGISICGMVPLRAVPFRAICLIGMNEEAFPRRDEPAPFDLPGDTRRRRSERDDDRYLFLQLLNAARDRFYLSWIGEDERDGSAREPSAVVAELLDILRSGYGAMDELVVKHALQPFSPRNFNGLDVRLFTYVDSWRASAATKPAVTGAAAFVDTVVASVPQAHTIDARDWLAFWRNPARHYFAQTLGMRLADEISGDDDGDELELGRRSGYALFDVLLDEARAGTLESTPTLADRRAQGLLPVGAVGSQAYAQMRTPTQAIARAWEAALGDCKSGRQANSERLHLELGPLLHLDTGLPQHEQGVIVRASLQAANGVRLLAAWFDLLVLAASGQAEALLLLDWDDKKQRVQARRVVAPSVESARSLLRDLALGYASGAAAPLLFFPKSAQVYVERWLKIGPDEAAGTRHAASLEKAAAAFAGGFHRGEGADSAFALTVRGRDPFEPSSAESRTFGDIARQVFEPLLRALQTESDAPATLPAGTDNAVSAATSRKSRTARKAPGARGAASESAP